MASRVKYKTKIKCTKNYANNSYLCDAATAHLCDAGIEFFVTTDCAWVGLEGYPQRLLHLKHAR
jgi:hypothetical protein